MTPNRRRLHIVVTCANRKRRPSPVTLRLRLIPRVQPKERVARWLEQLTAEAGETVTAEKLYAGEHWDVARSLPSIATEFSRSMLWVVSAGWGLIPVDAPIRAYSATFSPGHLDSVATDANGTRIWWGTLAAWQGPTPGRARSLAALVAEHPRDRVLVSLSEAYLTACEADLRAALSLARPGQVSIISAGLGQRADLASWRLPADARLQHVLGGTRAALNARIVADLLRAGANDHQAMHDRLCNHLARAPELVAYRRRRLTDADVIDFIRARHARYPQASRSGLLRELRDAGMACEQTRFRGLFAAAGGGAS